MERVISALFCEPKLSSNLPKTIHNKTPLNLSGVLLWRARQDSNLQPSDP